MRISDMFPKKELNKEEEKKRHYDKEMKKIKRKLWKNPMKVLDFVEEATVLMDKMIKDGLMTEEKKAKILTQFSNDMDKMRRFTSGISKLRGR